MVFQLVRVELNAEGQEVGRRVTQPLYECREDAVSLSMPTLTQPALSAMSWTP